MSHGPPSSSPLRLVRVPLASALTPWDALRTLRDDRRPFALTGAWAGGGAVLGSEPTLVAPRGTDPFVSIGSLPAVESADADADAVGGGWFGWLGYPAGARADVMPAPPPRPVVLPEASLAWYDHVLRLDAGGRWWFEALWSEQSADRLTARLSALRARLAGSVSVAGASVGTFASRPSRAGHEAAVAECVEYIRAGDLYQANLTLRLEATFAGSALDLWAGAAASLEPRYAAFVSSPSGDVVSLSPELFLRRRGRDVVTAPIKGTAPRVPGAREALLASAKDRAENVMILDLMRNDLGRVSEFGSVRVTDVARAEAHAGVWHLVSEVAGRLRADVGDADLLRATFPPGSVTGAPKLKALEVISTLESTGREAYTGAIGFASPLAGLELNVAIRTFEVAAERIWLGVGGGVVADSEPGAEYEEALVKARPLLAAIGAGLAPSPPGPEPAVRRAAREPRPDPARGVFTTLATDDGRAIDLDRHLARLAASAAALYGVSLDLDRLARRVLAHAGTPQRVRVEVLPTGETAVVAAHRDAAFPAQALRLAEPLVLPGGAGEHKWLDRGVLDGPERLVVDLDGTVLETTRGNVFAVLDGRIVTPPADGRILPGVTRAHVLEAFDVELGPVDLDRADEVFVTSSIRVAQAVRGGPVTRAVAAALLRARTGSPSASRSRPR